MDELIQTLEQVLARLDAYDSICKRAEDAHKYCQDYLMPEAWGKNIWHAILDDAIKLRKQLNG